MTQTNYGGENYQTRTGANNTNYFGDTYIYNRPYASLGAPFQAPPLPRPYIDRPESRIAVKTRLLTEEPTTPGTLVVSAIFGLGGIGKSVLAAVLAHDPEVQAHFPDGILWATLGQQPDILPFLSSWIQALKDYDYKPTMIDTASGHLRTLLYDKKVLLVVDDVWNPDHVEPFRVGGSGCRVLVTTREAKIPDAERYDMDTMTPEQSLELLLQKAQCPNPSSIERQQAETLAQEVGFLPLALELAGAQIADGVLWSELLEDLQAEIARLESLEDLSASSVGSEKNRKRFSLLASFNLSLRQLSPEQLRQFAWLGVLPEDVSLTQDMAATLWQVTPRQAGAILRFLWSKALLLPGVKQLDQKSTYRLHDLMHDLAKGLITSPQMSDRDGITLAGLGLSLSEAHEILLNHYRSKTKQGQWHTLHDDGYIHAHLTWHFQQLGQANAVHQLLQETTPEGRNGWYESCEKLGATAIFVADVARAWRLAEAQYATNPAQSIGLQIRYALISTTLSSLAENIPVELIAVLVRRAIWTPAQGLAYAQHAQEPDKKASVIQELAPYLPKTFFPKALQILSTIDNKWHGSEQVKTLLKLAPLLPQAALSEALEVARALWFKGDRAYALLGLAAYFPEVLPEALETAHQIQLESHPIKYPVRIFAELVPRLQIDLQTSLQVLHKPLKGYRWNSMTGGITFNLEAYYQVETMAGLAFYLPEIVPEALEIAKSIQDESCRVKALALLSPYLPDVIQELLSEIRSLQNSYVSTNVLKALAPHLTADLLLEVLTLVPNPESIKVVAPHLPTSSLAEVLTLTRNLKTDYDRADVLWELVPLLPAELLPEALEIARNLEKEYEQPKALIALVLRLPEVVPEALTVIRDFQEEHHRAALLVMLSSHLPEIISEALTAIRTLQAKYPYDGRGGSGIGCSGPTEGRCLGVFDMVCRVRKTGGYYERLDPPYIESFCVFLLEGLVPHLSADFFPEALAIALSFQGKANRINALQGLIPYLPDNLLVSILDEICNIQDQDRYVSILVRLSPYIPQVVPEALEKIHSAQAHDQAILLLRLIPHLPAEFLPEVLAMVSNLSRDSWYLRALVSLSPHFPEVVPEALAMIRSFPAGRHLCHEFKQLIPYLPAELLPEALAIVQDLSDNFDRSCILEELPSYLPPELFPQALEIVYTLQAERRSQVLVAWAPHLPIDVLPEVLKKVRCFSKKTERAKVLIALAVHLPDTLSETLTIARSIQDQDQRTNVLISLAPYLPELLPEALAEVRSIQEEDKRAYGLVSLIPHLPIELLAEALAVVRSLKDLDHRAYALAELVPFSPDVIPEALETANGIAKQHHQLRAFQRLLPYVPEVIPEIIATIQNVELDSESVYEIEDMMPHLLPHMTPELFSEVLSIIRDTPHNGGGFESVFYGIVEELDPTTLNFSLFRVLLQALNYGNRTDFLEFIPSLSPAIIHLGGPEALVATADAIRDVFQQWQ